MASDAQVEAACRVAHGLEGWRRISADTTGWSQRERALVRRMLDEADIAAWTPIAMADTADDKCIIMMVWNETQRVIGEGYFDKNAGENATGAWCWSIDGQDWPAPTHFRTLPPAPRQAT
jgi:hypothetical protein